MLLHSDKIWTFNTVLSWTPIFIFLGAEVWSVSYRFLNWQFFEREKHKEMTDDLSKFITRLLSARTVGAHTFGAHTFKRKRPTGATKRILIKTCPPSLCLFIWLRAAIFGVLIHTTYVWTNLSCCPDIITCLLVKVFCCQKKFTEISNLIPSVFKTFMKTRT